MELPAEIRWKEVPGHHAKYDAFTDRYGDFWIWFYCTVCGDVSRKRCYRPQLVTRWVMYYCDDHAHGLTRRMR